GWGRGGGGEGGGGGAGGGAERRGGAEVLGGLGDDLHAEAAGVADSFVQAAGQDEGVALDDTARGYRAGGRVHHIVGGRGAAAEAVPDAVDVEGEPGAVQHAQAFGHAVGGAFARQQRFASEYREGGAGMAFVHPCRQRGRHTATHLGDARQELEGLPREPRARRVLVGPAGPAIATLPPGAGRQRPGADRLYRGPGGRVEDA